jgi:hypothetical protein|tara:strand:+ start:5402 stop:5680 length:279 start_codon:yes stop_codon:yes gene_type:complete
MSSDDGYALVFVDWVDSCENVDNSDQSVYELPEPQRIFQVGFLVHEEEGHIVVCGAMKPMLESFDYAIAIPRVAINTIRTLVFEDPKAAEDL